MKLLVITKLYHTYACMHAYVQSLWLGWLLWSRLLQKQWQYNLLVDLLDFLVSSRIRCQASDEVRWMDWSPGHRCFVDASFSWCSAHGLHQRLRHGDPRQLCCRRRCGMSYDRHCVQGASCTGLWSPYLRLKRERHGRNKKRGSAPIFFLRVGLVNSQDIFIPLIIKSW